MIEFAINLAGAVALLLWSVRMIRTGVERAFSAQLRSGLRRASRASFGSLGGGALAAFCLQSSTAVAMLAAGFVAAGTLGTGPGLALLLGADVGSALVAQILVHPVTLPVPILLAGGTALFLKGRSRRMKQIGRILIGFALVFVALSMIRASTAPLADNPLVAMVVSYLSGDLLSAFAIGAVLAWAMHSSLAAVLTTAAFVTEGPLPAVAAAAMVLGANLGGAMIPVSLTMGAAAEARRIVLGNLLLRGGGALGALWALATVGSGHLGLLGGTGLRQVINLHLLFNLAVALVALPLVPLVLRAIAALVPGRPAAVRQPRISALDQAALSDPDRALACTAREVLRMGETVQGMLLPVLRLTTRWDQDTADGIAEAERAVDRMHFETKLYIARLQKGRLDDTQARRALSFATIATGLEEAGDQISTNLLQIARRMQSEGLAFSPDGLSDLEDFHDAVLGNVQLALNVLVTGDPEAARQLLEEKERTRSQEQRLQARHLARLRMGNPASIDTSNRHQEILRALKQVNTAFSMVAYPIAEDSGDLLASRLSDAPGKVAARPVGTADTPAS